jgi:hypothetical protein
MICYMKNRNDLPLLQYCASFCDLPLLVYTPPPHWAAYGNRPDVELGGRIYPKRVFDGLVEVDLDVWLVFELLRYGDVRYSANDVLRSFAETMGGAHHDKSIDPKIEELFKHSRRTFGSRGIFDESMLVFLMLQSAFYLLATMLLDIWNPGGTWASRRRDNPK